MELQNIFFVIYDVRREMPSLEFRKQFVYNNPIIR